MHNIQAKKTDVTFANFYTMSSDLDHPSLCYYTDIQGLFQEIGIVYSASDWRLFFDSSKQSLKALLLHNGNVYPSIPIAHFVRIKEDRESVKKLFELIRYNNHNWDVCGDFKIIAFLLGWQGGYTKYSCFLCGIAEQMSSTTWSKTGHLAKIPHQAFTTF